jgi:oxygen-dependent protoporphyrinogen oxidase
MIGVVGGGISGLALGWHLRARGVPHVVLEAEEAPGGVMRTERAEGLVLDVGPQRTRMTADVAELVEAAGLEDEVLRAPEDAPLYVYRAGKLRKVPFSLGAALTTDLLGWSGKLRILAEPFTQGPRPDETVEAFFTRKFGSQAYRTLIGPLYGGLYASDPGRMYARHGLSTTLEHFGVKGSLLLALLRRGARARQELATISFTGGMQMLPAALAERLGEGFRAAARVTALRRLESDDPGAPRWRLEVADGEPVDVDRVVLSLSAPQAAEVLRGEAPDAAGRIGRLRYNRLAVVHLRADRSPGGVPLHGFGYQVAFGEPLETRGCTWNGPIFDRDRLCAAYLGGMRHPELLEWDDQRIVDTALEEFRAVTGHDARALNVGRTWIPAWDGSWDALDGLELPEGVELCANWNARPGIPGRASMAKRVAERLAAG